MTIIPLTCAFTILTAKDYSTAAVLTKQHDQCEKFKLHLFDLLACDAFVMLLPWCSSICLSGTGMHCDQMVHFSADLSLWLDSPMFWASGHQCMSTYSKPSFSSSTRKTGRVWMCKLGEESNATNYK